MAMKAEILRIEECTPNRPVRRIPGGFGLLDDKVIFLNPLIETVRKVFPSIPNYMSVDLFWDMGGIQHRQIRFAAGRPMPLDVRQDSRREFTVMGCGNIEVQNGVCVFTPENVRNTHFRIDMPQQAYRFAAVTGLAAWARQAQR